MNGRMAENIRGSIIRIKNMEGAHTYIQMGVDTKANGKMVLKMG